MGETNGEKRKKSTKKTSKSTKIIAIIFGTFALIAIAGGVSYYLGLIHSIMGWERAHSRAEITLGKPVFVPLPEIRTDLKTNECRAPFLRAVIHVQLSPEDVPRLEEAQPQVMDAILTHLRGQERQGLVGKEGSERLRFELVQIIENIIKPAKVHTVLFKDLVVQ